MFGWLYKRSKRQVIRDNAAKGAEAERTVKAKFELMGYKMERTGRGSDFKASRHNYLTGKNESKLVEVKTGDAKLSPLQKKRKRSWGKRYVEERVSDSPFYPASTFGPKKARKSRSSSSGGSKRAKSAVETIWGPSSPSGGSKKARKSRSSPSGGSKRAKSAVETIWGPSPSGGSKKARKSRSPSIF